MINCFFFVCSLVSKSLFISHALPLSPASYSPELRRGLLRLNVHRYETQTLDNVNCAYNIMYLI
jgi:hypothetical protein